MKILKFLSSYINSEFSGSSLSTWKQPVRKGFISILGGGTEPRAQQLPQGHSLVRGGAGVPFQLILSEEALLLLTHSLPYPASRAARLAFVSLCSAMYLS